MLQTVVYTTQWFDKDHLVGYCPTKPVTSSWLQSVLSLSEPQDSLTKSQDLRSLVALWQLHLD